MTAEYNIYRQIKGNVIRTWMIIGVFFITIVGVAYGFSLYMQDYSIIIIAVVFAVVSNVFSYYMSETIALSVNQARKADRNNPDELQLIRIVENMAITAGIPMPGVYIIDDDAPNAFATGRNHDHASVAFTTGILRLLNKTELEGVAAHELSHIKNRDILVGTIVVIMIGFVAILADMFIRMGLSRQGNSSNSRSAGVIVIVSLVFAILSPIIGRLIQFAVSRRREYLADVSGALLTRYPEGLASALIKISGSAQPLKHTSTATRHLFISDPMGNSKKNIGSAVSGLFSSHPPVESRVQALLGDDMKKQLFDARSSDNSL